MRLLLRGPQLRFKSKRIRPRRAYRAAVGCLAVISPQGLKRFIYQRCFGWSIDPAARIGWSLILVDHLVMEANSAISHGNILKGCDYVELGKGAGIGMFNWISGPSVHAGGLPKARSPRLVLGCRAKITNRHLIDCSDLVELGDYAVVAGNRSQILTHGPQVETALQSTAPVTIGSHSVVFTAAILLAGSSIPNRCVVAAGAVVVGPLTDELTVYGGVPAVPIKRLPQDSAYFQMQPFD
jgi:acetyltransferase-like isoleucine patch superfamily enzyme